MTEHTCNPLDPATWPVADDPFGLANEAARAFDQGEQAAIAGLPRPDGPQPATQGWDFGNAKRRIRAGEAIGLVCQGTICDACGDQNWGWRLGCRCSLLPLATVRHGLLVDDGLAEGECAKFMTVEEVRATGKPLIDNFSGADVPLPPAPQAEESSPA